VVALAGGCAGARQVVHEELLQPEKPTRVPWVDSLWISYHNDKPNLTSGCFTGMGQGCHAKRNTAITIAESFALQMMMMSMDSYIEVERHRYLEIISESDGFMSSDCTFREEIAIVSQQTMKINRRWQGDKRQSGCIAELWGCRSDNAGVYTAIVFVSRSYADYFSDLLRALDPSDEELVYFVKWIKSRRDSLTN